MKTFYTIIAYAISIVVMLTVIYRWNSEYAKPAAIAIVGALIIQQGVKWIFRDQIKDSKFKQHIHSTFANIPDDDDRNDSNDDDDDVDETVHGKAEVSEVSEYLGRPAEDGY